MRDRPSDDDVVRLALRWADAAEASYVTEDWSGSGELESAQLSAYSASLGYVDPDDITLVSALKEAGRAASRRDRILAIARMWGRRMWCRYRDVAMLSACLGDEQ